MMYLCYILVIYLLVASSLEDGISPTSPVEYFMEGSSVNLSCNYNVKANNLQWYRQYTGSAPAFLLLITDTSSPTVVNATPPYPRLTAKLNKERSRVDLEISSAEVTDSALYYSFSSGYINITIGRSECSV
uniref:Ig-like domain-containing protein n=1 Tax=Esox lucius TaxID=8010 RepID=A0A3P8ZTW6_ESOLU